MLNCRASSWRCLRALQPSPLRPSLASSLVVHSRSQHTRSDRDTFKHGAARNPDRGARGESQPKKAPWSLSLEAFRQRRAAKTSLSTIPVMQEDKDLKAGDMWLGKRDGSIPAAEWNARKKELQWLKDPLEIATFVKKELRKDRADEMLQLVRMASHSMQVIVSWNHLIDYHMFHGKMSAAMKIYTEKRAQFPDSYTYTIILRGLSNNVGRGDVATKAITVYHSMLAPNSRVQPTILHTNAVLRVCARALNLDALWGVVAKMPQSGPGAADAITYTTILNAIRQSLLVDVPTDENAEEIASRREKGVVEGRRIWEEVIGKWRNADLVMEEELVCSMGRLLLVGSRPRDWDDVLSLIEQTMDIPRLVPRLGTLARKAAGVPDLRAPHTLINYKQDDQLESIDGHKRGDEFLAVKSSGAGKRSLVYAQPGNNTLSLVLEACQKVVAVEAANAYWNTITDHTTYGVVPDVNNLNFRFRLMRQNRASTAAITLLKDDFLAAGLQLSPGTCRIIMSTCVRDRNNHRSLQNASELLSIMLAKLPDVDSKTVSMYTKLVVGFPLLKGDDLIESLSILQPIIKNIRLQLSVGSEDRVGGKGAVRLHPEKRQEAIDALRGIYGIYDKLLGSDLIAKDAHKPFMVERARLSAFMARVTYKDGYSRRDMYQDVVEGSPDAADAAPRWLGRKRGDGDERGGAPQVGNSSGGESRTRPAFRIRTQGLRRPSNGQNDSRID
ncbi:unnamed protein product [Periconia digitata]|uniref:Pentatricopeptide repeat protein n=1 Tax=Periconia digitata TaxID=1303443 RepID=A0A9W4URS6_9PLEO|nr:unnamed protein product [Periconia digitata]